jgi:drug/metabolite transporter (DMT)-like permease
MTALWMPVTVSAAGFQVARNALQRGLMPKTGPWGATLVRFLFGLPFSIVFTLVALAVSRHVAPNLGWAFWAPATLSALTQMLATAALLVAMERAGFAVATALQQSSVPLAALTGLLVFGDNLTLAGWTGIGLTTAGLAALMWPDPRSAGKRPVSGVILGVVSGLCFGFSLNGVRHAGLALDAGHPLFAAMASVVIVQAAQASALTLVLAVWDRAALAAVAAGWRQSLGAGFAGACASAGWFLALNLEEAAPVRALGVVEIPIAAIAGRRLFRERLSLRQIVAGVTVAIGVVLTAGA